MIVTALVQAIARVSSDDHAARHEAAEQSPLHVLPAPVLVVLALSCLVLAACVAGLTLGLMSLDTTGLGIVMQSNDARQAAAARAILPVRMQGNLLLVTLLFANTLATELLPLVLEALVPGGYFSLVVSVVSIMLFGEIIPQAVCSRHALLIGSYMIGFVKVLRTVLYPLAAPIAYMLDVFLGEELATIYNREELKGLIDVHRRNAVLTQDETTILKGALEFSQKSVDQILTPAKHVFKLDIDSQLDRETLLRVLRSGHSRIPLYEQDPNNIVCLLLVKQLILVNPQDKIPIRALISKKKRNHKMRVAPALECSASTLISDLLNEFQKGRSHMAMVYDDIAKPSLEREFIGIVSIEDIIEEILQEEIIDETDNFTDNTNKTKVLVRNTDGLLVRTTAENTRAVVVPGSNAAVLVKEIDVSHLRAPLGEVLCGQKVRPDWKKTKPKKKRSLNHTSSSASVSDPLLRFPFDEDVEQGFGKSEGDIDSTRDFDSPLIAPEGGPPSPPRLMRGPIQNDTAAIQYAKMPGQSSLSLFGEDDPIMPEDMAHPKVSRVSPTLSVRFEQDGDGSCGEIELKPQLKVRPLPEDASDERAVQIPTRNRSSVGRVRASQTSAGRQSYGSTRDLDDIGLSGDEEPLEGPMQSPRTTLEETPLNRRSPAEVSNPLK